MNAKQYREQRDAWMRRAWAAEDALKDINNYAAEGSNTAATLNRFILWRDGHKQITEHVTPILNLRSKALWEA